RHFLDQHAQITAHDFALAAQLRQQLLYEIDRNSEADADITAGAAEDRRVDADDFAAQIEERPAGIARIDRRVGLNEVVVRPLADVPALRADDTRRHRAVETERIADRHDPFAD